MEAFKDIALTLVTNTELLQLLGLVIGSLLIWLLKRVIAWVGLKLRADQSAMLTAAVDKAMTLAVVRAERLIEERGWAAPESRHEVLTRAVPILEEKFRDTLRDNGLNPTSQGDRQRIYEMMERMVPDVFSRAAASPATPSAPIVPAVVVPSNTGA